MGAFLGSAAPACSVTAPLSLLNQNVPWFLLLSLSFGLWTFSSWPGVIPAHSPSGSWGLPPLVLEG